MGDEYNVFISWSGPQSEWVARALRDWLPVVIQTAKPWMSAADIEKGSRGLDEVSSRLQGMKVGIVCLTPENLNEPWILYEAGALSKTIDDKTRLCTYLLGGLEFQDVKPPLGIFQATKANKQDTHKLVRTINRAASDTPIPDTNLDILFDHMWPDLEKQLKALPESNGVAAPKRSVEDVVTEILELARSEVNSRKAIQAQISHIETVLNRAPFGDWALSFLDSPATLNYSYEPVTGTLRYGPLTKMAVLKDLVGTKTPAGEPEPSKSDTQPKKDRKK